MPDSADTLSAREKNGARHIALAASTFFSQVCQIVKWQMMPNYITFRGLQVPHILKHYQTKPGEARGGMLRLPKNRVVG